MREILFRGKRRDNGQWIEGFFVLAHDHNAPDEKTPHIAVDMPWGPCGCCAEVFEVDPATVGQYTGKTDRNGVKMFEDDVISDSHERCVIKWGEYECAFVTGDYYDNVLTNVDAECYEVIGNIHDNPEIEVEEYWL